MWFNCINNEVIEERKIREREFFLEYKGVKIGEDR